jgi:hypothetical protein
MKRYAWIWAGLAIFSFAASVEAKATWVKKAQAEDPAVKSCLACHTSVKVTPKDLQLNARGQFLVDKKKETGAKETDLAWLKEYKEPAKK